jgi:effector-binding domain-containing protein
MTDTAPYEVLEKFEEIEIRRYPPLVVATVTGPGGDSEFGHLFNYITGNNRTKLKIAMTAPVITSERVDMTAPVISDKETMSFVMPQKYTMETLPEPIDPRVRIQQLPERKVAAVRFKGHAGERTVEGETELLLCEIGKAGLTAIGKPFLMRYNSPFTPGFMRRNEVGIEIR